MKYKLATILLVVAALVVGTFSAATTTPPALAAKPKPTTTTSPPPGGGSTFVVDGCPASSDPTAPKKPPCKDDNVILRWDEQLLSAIRAYPAQTGPTITARALGVLHTATYDAWAAYDPVAKVTRSDGPAQQQAASNTLENKQAAISYAAVRVLNDLFPVPSTCASPPDPPTPFCPIPPSTNPPSPGYQPPNTLLQSLDYPINTNLPADPNSTTATPAEVGNLAAKAVLDFRHDDGSNQLGGYANPSSTPYTSANDWNVVNDRWRWQPLCVLTALGVKDGFPAVRDPTAASCPDSTTASQSHYAVQKPLTPQWGSVTPFSAPPSQYEVLGPTRNADGSCCSTADIVTAAKDTSYLSDSSKTRAEYWADGPKSEFPPGHTAVFAQALSRKQKNSLDTDAKLFFLVGNAMLDASIAAWYQKYDGGWPTVSPFTKYDFVRPITAIREYYKTQNPPIVHGAWLGPPNYGFGDVPAEKWMPYQAVTVVTPPFPEYVSGHSTFTAAGATMLAQFNASDAFGGTVIIKAGSSQIEKGGPVPVPAQDVKLTWATFSDASNDAGMSRRWGGIHFASGDIHGRGLGRQVATNVWGTGQSYIKGYIGK